MEQQVRVLTLQTNQNHESKLFRIQKGWVVQFRRGASLFGKAVELFTNHPSEGSPFLRTSYRQLTWRSDSGNTADDTGLFTEITFTVAGTFRYYFTLAQGSSGCEGSGYFVVDPSLVAGPYNEAIPLDCVQCQTFLSKNLGPFPEWKAKLRVARETGYNLIHFTPVQTLGGSNSAYSLRDQHGLNVTFHSGDKKCTLQDIASLVEEMRSQWGVMSLVDIVLNHTANESDWLQEHPEATYNTANSPHLRPAFVVDRALYYCSRDVASGKLAAHGIPANLCTQEQVGALWNHIYHEVLLPLALHEFFSVDVDVLVKQFHQKAGSVAPSSSECGSCLQIIQDPQYRRLKSSVDMDLALKIYNRPQDAVTESERLTACCQSFRSILEQLNEGKRKEMDGHMMAACDATIGTVSYERLAEDGPKLTEVSAKHPLVPPYFTYYDADSDLRTDEAQMSMPDKGPYFMAHNGWVMDQDCLKNFAEEGSNVYLRRAVVAWGDSVKLRFGDKPEDSPFLWDYMKRYCEDTARTFHGIRLDNCHSTPIHVAEYLLDAARKVRPDLYVIAELFTNSDDVDNIFVNRLGINSLIREAMSAPDSHEEGRLVFRYGGVPVGAFMPPPVRPLVPSVAHAILLDLTHDNPSPVEKRTAFDMLPSTALVNMACCASGSNRGYDELVPHHIHVVTESRLYSSFSDKETAHLSPGEINSATGIITARKILNDLHYKLGKDGFSQVFVDQVTEDIVTVTRHNPVSHESVILVAFTSFRPPGQIHPGHIRPLKVEGSLDSILFELEQKPATEGDEHKACPGKFAKDPKYINGLDGITVVTRELISLDQARFVCKSDESSADTLALNFTEAFRPGCVVAFKFSLHPSVQTSVNSIRQILKQFVYLPRLNEVEVKEPDLLAALKQLDLVSLSRCLYNCQEEEEDEGRGGGVYQVPNFDRLVYCGLQGLESAMKNIRVNNDLGHPLCGNLRDGNWLLDYTADRLVIDESTKAVGLWLADVFKEVKLIPRYLIPAYFDAVVNKLYLSFINRAWQLMLPFVKKGSLFTKQLGLCSVQFVSVVRSAPLPSLSANLTPPMPSSMDGLQRAPSIAAGLPHFCKGYMRNWGRDTFIALPGNLLLTGRFQEARWIILAFAGTLRHGLIPNLLDGGLKARFNCRDAVWFWLMAIQKYVEMAPEGHLIFQDKVSRLFPRDDSEINPSRSVQQTLEFVIQEALTRHFQGCSFRERNAGRAIDEQMTDMGFNNSIGVDLETGFPFGGNEWNCGTWMDKMGSSDKAGNKGRPATPRDGSAVEIVGLCKAAVTFLDKMFKENRFSYQGVSRIEKGGSEVNWTYLFWSDLIKNNFDRCFYVSPNRSAPERVPEMVNKRGIYKDSYKASKDWPDYQLRCNFPIAIAVAPDLVEPMRGLEALAVVEKSLLGPLGIKTLDPDDYQYRANYDNSNDSAEFHVARGFNYHQGPEWLWPVGFFLRAKLALAQRLKDPEMLASTVASIKSRLSRHFSHLLKDNWRSLPELTNEGGNYCRDSNPAQSWSTGCILEVLWDLKNLP